MHRAHVRPYAHTDHEERLTMSIRDQIFLVMYDGRWRTGLEIAHAIGRESFTTGIAAKLRQLRRPEFGGHIIESVLDPQRSKLSGQQVWRYRMLIAGRTISRNSA